MQIIRLSILTVVLLAAIGLVLTWVANALNRRGLGDVGVDLWLCILAVSAYRVHRNVSWPAVMMLVMLWFVSALIVYEQIGSRCFGWIGLAKP